MLASLIAGLASGETALAIRRARRAAVVYLVAAAGALCGIGFLLGAIYIWVSDRYGALEAAIGIGVAFLALSGIILVVHSIISRAQARRAKDRRASDLTAVAVASVLAALPTLLRRKGGLGAAVAPAIALVAYAIYRENRRPKARKPDLDRD